MPRHNLRPEVVPAVLEVLRESRQAFGKLRDGDGCYCMEGVVCEAYRREHPSDARWESDVFIASHEEALLDGCIHDFGHVAKWATHDGGGPTIDGNSMEKANDEDGYTFADFERALTEDGDA